LWQSVSVWVVVVSPIVDVRLFELHFNFGVGASGANPLADPPTHPEAVRTPPLAEHE
jgi:hypothetical protein